jgi:hypothetical protein
LTDDGVTLKSKGQVAILSDSSMSSNVYATAKGGGIGAGSEARAYSTINSGDDTDGDGASNNTQGTLTKVGQGAHIEADTLRLNAEVSHLSVWDHSYALAGGFVAVAISDSNVNTHSAVQTLIDSAPANGSARQ